MAGVSLKCGACGALLKSVQEAQDHAELTSHSNFSESTEAVLNLVCSTCGKPCRSKTESDLHTKRTGHTEFEDKTSETTKPISLETPPAPMDVDEPSADVSTSSQPEEMVPAEVDKKLLEELEEMGFPIGRATRALHYSGNASLDAAVNWVVEHEDDPDIDEVPLVPANTKVEAPKPSLTPEEMKLKAQELRERARKKKEEEEKRTEREKEKERIRIGKELLEAKRIEEENERKRILALRKAEKEEEKRAREKIRQKLEEDKAERRRKLGLPPEDPATVKPAAPVVEEKKSFLPVRPATKQEQMRECLRSLKQNHKLHHSLPLRCHFQLHLPMEPNRTSSPDPTKRTEPPEKLKRIEWEDYEQEAARLISLSSAVAEAKSKKETIEKKLQALIEVKAESLGRLNELEEMKQRVESRKLVMGRMATSSKVAAEEVMKEEERLSMEVRSLLVAGTTLSVVRKQLEESRRLLAEERGCVRLRSLQKMLRLRQQYMVSQISLLYPVKISAGPSEEQELESFPSSSRTGNFTGSKPANQGSLTILGLHLSLLPFTKMSFFTDKKEVQRSATALGYVAHAVSLIASYLEVPLRYPLRLGGSHSYINDYAPSIEPSSSDSSSTTLSHANAKPVEFPLFLDGQDTTRAAYAVFLLNKDLEQLLNYIGIKSLGPRHVLANLKELTRTIQSAEFLDM